MAKSIESIRKKLDGGYKRWAEKKMNVSSETIGIVKDIESRKDIENLMKKFYEKVLGDVVIGFIFTDIEEFDVESHLPVISDFWETVLFGVPKYKVKGKVMKVHSELNNKIVLKKGYFDRWLFLFNQTVDELFHGSRANEIKKKARDIASAMQKQLTFAERIP